ncbi:MAG: hypothetical protein ACRCVW_01335 [Brevinema sp.]
MFLKLMKHSITFYIFGISFSISFMITVIRGLGIFRGLFSGLSGGVAFVIVWGVFIKILELLLSTNELESIFGLPRTATSDTTAISNEIEETDYNTEDDLSDELTMEEMYQDMDHRNNENDHIDKINTSADVLYDDELELDHLSNNDPVQISEIGEDGTFDFTVNGKTLRTTPENGAKAARKLLKQDHEE